MSLNDRHPLNVDQHWRERQWLHCQELGPKPAEQHRSRAARMELETGTLEPLGQHHVAGTVGFDARRRERQTEEAQRLALADTIVAIFEAMRAPVVEKYPTHITFRLGKTVTRAWRRLPITFRAPIASRPPEQLVAQAPKQHIVGWSQMRVRLEPLALKELEGRRGVARSEKRSRSQR